LRPVHVAPNQLVAGMVKLLGRSLGETIPIMLDLAPDLWATTVDPARLEASLTNLATNARDAMPKGARLSIITGNRHLDAAYTRGAWRCDAGRLRDDRGEPRRNRHAGRG